MNITIIGTGYVGLVSGACFAEFGTTVTCVDKDKDKIDKLKNGIIPFYEPGLEELVKRNMGEERLKFSTDIADAVRSSLVIFIAVGTPPRGDGSADIIYVEEVAKVIAKNLDEYKVIVTKSTVPVGTGKRMRDVIFKENEGKSKFDIISNPEFLREGSAIEDFMRPNRVVIGSESEQATAIIKDLYRPLYLIETPFIITNITTSELIKYASNSFLAIKVSFINEIANLCEKVGADVHDVARGMGLDNRIGKKFLHAGPGFGGSCFPKDARALLSIASESDMQLKIVSAAYEVNERQKSIMVEKIKSVFPELKDKVFSILGLSFKPNTDDIREAPSLFIIESLLKEGSAVRVFDPEGMSNTKEIFPEIYYAKDTYDAIKGTDALILVTEWNQFRNLKFKEISKIMKSPVFFDLRNVYEPKKMKEFGFRYYSVGRG